MIPFPVEQPAFKSELDLPALSPSQAEAIWVIKDYGGVYHRHVDGAWYPTQTTCDASRQTDRTVLSLIRSGWLTVIHELNGKPVRVRPTFP